jgi:hypothetical protein
MKPQDIVFFTILVAFLFFKKYTWLVYAGIGSLFLSIPLFATWTFFTAQRLTWYAMAFLAIFVLSELVTRKGESV